MPPVHPGGTGPEAARPRGSQPPHTVTRWGGGIGERPPEEQEWPSVELPGHMTSSLSGFTPVEALLSGDERKAGGGALVTGKTRGAGALRERSGALGRARGGGCVPASQVLEVMEA